MYSSLESPHNWREFVIVYREMRSRILMSIDVRKDLPCLSRGERVTNTISTTQSTSIRPNVFKSSSWNCLGTCVIFAFSIKSFKLKSNSWTFLGDSRKQVAPASNDRVARFAAIPLSPTIRWTWCVQSSDVKRGTGMFNRNMVATMLWHRGFVWLADKEGAVRESKWRNFRDIVPANTFPYRKFFSLGMISSSWNFYIRL